jgi:hypothetical protein
MKKLLLFLLCAPLCLAQTHTFSTTDQPNVFTAPQQFAAGSIAGPILIANLPLTPAIGLKLTVLDPSSTTDCTSGGGNQVSPPPHECYWNGFAWATSSTSSLPVPLSIALGGTNSTNPCGTTNAVLIWNGSSFSCVSYILSTATGMQIGTPGQGYIDIPTGASNPGNPSSGYHRLWSSSGNNQTQCLTSAGANCFAGGGGSGYTLQLNGSTLTANDTVNFNGTTPAAPSNGLLIKFQTSRASTTDSVSAYVLGDGNAGDCLVGTGIFSTCPGGGGGSATSQLLTTVNGGDAGCTGNVCTGSAADQVVYSFSVGNPGNGKCVEVKGWYRTTTSSSGAKAIKVKFGATAAWAFATYTTAGANQSLMSFQICNNQSSHTAQTAVELLPIIVNNAFQNNFPNPGTAAIDWSAGAQTIQIIQNAPATEAITWDMGQVITLQ